MKGKSVISLILLLIVITGSIFLAVVGVGTNKTGSLPSINLGLDLAGGVSITYTTSKENPEEQEIKDTIYKLQQRTTSLGYTEAEVYREGDARINVDIPNVADPNKVLAELGKPGDLKFLDETGAIVISGSDVKNATAGKSPDGLGYVVILDLNADGSKKFATGTTANVGKPIVIVYNGVQIMAPVVNEPILNGTATISGMSSIESADELASYIRIGALPLELKELRSNVVGAKMGQDAISSSLKAALIGILIIFAFMIIFYRIQGLAASIGLAVYSALMINFISILGFTLTLPGIAGIILSVGMAVDANVIIFARIKEEIAVGKTLQAAVRAGFKKAYSAIFDGNITTLIAAAVLYIMGTGTVRGFAQTLGLGILISMFTALIVTRGILTLFVTMGFKNKALYGASKEIKFFDYVSRRKIWFAISAGVIVIGLIFLPINLGVKETPLNYDIEFIGGTSTLVTTDAIMYDSIDSLSADIKDLVVEATGDESPQMNLVKAVDGQGQFVIKTKNLTTETGVALRAALVEKYGISEANIESESISATIGEEMQRSSIIAVIVASIGILIYVTFRFHDYRFGVAAVIALIHDVIIVFTVYSVFFIPINSSFIAAMLTIVGYSINDTIIVFDRIRENQLVMRRGDFKGVINASIGQTLIRSFNTSITTFIMIFILNLLGVASIREFAFPLMIGVLSGTYSSIFIASPLWYIFKKKEEAKILKAHNQTN
jgi:SecD/SecF fusion protein